MHVMRRDLGARVAQLPSRFPLLPWRKLAHVRILLFTITKGIALVKASTLRSELFEQGLW